MSTITIATKLRFLAAITPLILLIVSPIIALAFLEFGNIPSNMKDNQIAALRYAQGMDAALYKMEWGRTRPDGSQIVIDQQRRFADMLDSAVHHVYTTEQRDKLQALAQAAKPTLDALRQADPHDEVENAKMRDLHVMVTELENADEAALDQFSESAKSWSRRFVAIVLIAGVVAPVVCFALIWRFTGTVRSNLRALRSQLERIKEDPSGQSATIAPAIESIDEALAELGFPKPNPMLAEE